MSDYKPSSDQKTIIGTEGSGAHRRPLAPNEYSMHKPQGRFEQSGLLRPNGTNANTPVQPAGPSERTKRPSEPAAATTILPAGAVPSAPNTMPQGTPPPINPTLAGQPRARRGSQGPSIGGRSSQWDKHSDSNPNFEGDSTGVHA